MSATRRCACDCGEPLIGRSKRTKYLNERHKQRAYRRRVEAAAKAAGLSTRVSLKTVRATTTTGQRNGDGEKRPRKRQARRRKGATPYLMPRELDAAIAALERSKGVAAKDALAACIRARARLKKRTTR